MSRKPPPPEAPPGAPATELHVCHNCMVRLDSSLGGVDLPRRIREAVAARGLGPTTRVFSSGCLGECPLGLVTVLVLPPSGTGSSLQLIDAAKDGEDLAERLANPPPPAGPP
ncbi:MULTISPECIES: (2Fe-2S) ferredoxin domain-containing protein [Myxococcus]|uniref:(2Fe-2S) ferredoxin domain-containing protein n=1 Tax=Myxococcus TaxID=32 RepID=UPI00114167E8|nr:MULTISPECIES: (2Fe-2S) ferredoxin domain-containing protein [Myxococcus]MCK8499169.1 (2Fe-2S) ferredoxin domain-containing protein [Myxococcus fulvus]